MIITFFSVLFLGIWTGLLSLVKGFSSNRAGHHRAPVRDKIPIHREASTLYEIPINHREKPVHEPAPIFNETPLLHETPMRYELRRFAFAVISLIHK